MIQSLSRQFLCALAIASGLLVAVPTTLRAQSNSGLTIFSGVDREDILNYHLDYGGRRRGWDRYRLRIPAKKLPFGASEFIVSYPDYYEGKFDEEEIEVRIDGEPLPLESAIWDEENQEIAIVLAQPLVERQKVELVFSNVRNPRNGGTYYFNAAIQIPNDVRLRRYIGTWIIDID